MTRDWEFYTAPGGGNPVEKEITKARLTATEIGRLDLLMDRVSEGRAQPGDVKDLGGGLMEFKLNLAQRTYRLLYAEIDGGLVLLALHFFSKKKNNDRQAVNLARTRLRDWQQRR